MKKNKGNFIYIMACFFLCLLPFVGMAAAPDDSTTENRTLASFPQTKKEGRWNVDFMQELGSYFEDHFAFRPMFVMADSQIQSRIFGVSNMDTVIVGTDGWLYYSATLDDYLGQNRLSERGCFNAAHNLSLMQQYVEDKGAAFLLTIPPNKNSLYGEYMPYYARKKASQDKNIQRLKSELEKWNVSYADLFSVFQKEKEVLYLKRDSHWNQKGAVLAYNTMLDALNREHENYEATDAVRTKTEYGDLNKMMYPLGGEPEWNYQYQYEERYHYVTETKSVEDAWIQTNNPEGEGSLLMFRDSFGNTLLPLMANTFEDGFFSKETPYQLDSYMEKYHPQVVIVEKVERNLDEFASEPPVMTGPVVVLKAGEKTEKTDTDVKLEESEYAPDYWKISGNVDAGYVEMDTRIAIRVKWGAHTTVYEAYTVSGKEGDNGYVLYLPKDKILSDAVQIDVLTDNDGQWCNVKTKEFSISQLNVSGEE